MEKVKIVNLVASLNLNIRIDLRLLIERNPLANIEYEPTQFPAAIVRIKEPKASFLVFSTGKIICTGAKTLKQIKDSFYKVKLIITKTGVKIGDMPEIIITNMVVTTDLKKRFDLNKLAMNLENVEFEPEQFPALIYKILEPKAAFLIFSNGRIVCTGTKSLEIAKKAIRKLTKSLIF